MEAYKVKRGAKVKVTEDFVRTPPASLQVNTGDVITILNIDGAYCNCEDEDGNNVYVAAWTEVEEIKK